MTDLELFIATHPDLYKKFCEMGKAWVQGYRRGKQEGQTTFTLNKKQGRYYD